jgi:hypothetical protein
MTKINVITAPDKLFNDNYKLLLIFPSKQLLNEIQNRILTRVSFLDLYIYDKPNYNSDDIVWMLDTFKAADCVIIDVDNSAAYCRDLFSYLIAKPKTYWLTNAVDCVYNHISNNRLQDLNILSTIGDQIEEF